MSAFDRWSYDPDQDKPAEAAAADKPTKVVELDALAETRSQGEAYADTRQSFESGWERHRLFDAPRAELARFRTQRAGLPETSPEEAARYVEQHRIGRPWLAVAERASPESRRIMAAVDQGAGHGHAVSGETCTATSQSTCLSTPEPQPTSAARQRSSTHRR